MNKIQQYLRDREEMFDKRFVVKSQNNRIWDLQENGEHVTAGKIKSFHSETIKGLLQMLVEEEKKRPEKDFEKKHYSSTKMSNGRLFEVIRRGGHKCNSNCVGKPKEYINGYNFAKQETIDRLLEIK